MKTLIIDGQFNLKRNFFKLKSMTNNEGYFCGGIIGFLISIQSAISKVLPDKVIIVWDGFHSGKLRYEIHKPYKAFRVEKWLEENKMIENEGVTKDLIEKDNFELLIQKIELKNIVDELFIRQIEVDYMETNDLIAGYIIKNEEKEQIVIFGSPKDFNQLISKKVSLISPNNYEITTLNNFKNKNNYTLDNELLFKCFEGDKTDGIDGVKGITRNTLIKFFPDIVDVKYTYQDLCSKSNFLIQQENKKQKIYKKITESKNILHRNYVLLNLKKPFLNEAAEEEIEQLSDSYFHENKNIEILIESLNKDGYIDILKSKNINIKSFFSIFYMLMNKEKMIFKSF